MAYHCNQEVKKKAARERYNKDPKKKTRVLKQSYDKDPANKKRAVKQSNDKDLEKKKGAVKQSYDKDPEKKKCLSKHNYHKKSRKQKSSIKKSYTRNIAVKKASMNSYHLRHKKKDICAQKRRKFALSEPKSNERERHMKNLADKLFQDKNTLTNAFKCLQQPKASKATTRAVCNVASRQLLNRVLKYRRACAAELLGNIRSVKTVETSNKDDFGDTRHTASTESYFYDSAYQLIKRQQALPVDKQGKCVLAEITIVEKNKNEGNKKASSSEGKPAASNNSNASNKKSKDTMEIWPCTIECKAVTESEVQSIVSLRQSFDKTIDQLRQDLYKCDDGCPNTHIEKSRTMTLIRTSLCFVH